MSEEISKTINNLSYKFSQTFTYNNNKTDGIYKFPNNLGLSEDYIYTLKMNSYHGWHSLVNITTEHNKFRYYNGSTWKNITIPAGIWSFTDINTKLQTIMKANGDHENDTYFINFKIDENEYKSKLIITKANYKVDFNVNNSMNTVFGYEKKTYTIGTHKSENNPDINKSQACFITIDLIKPNVLFSNGKTKTLDYVRVIPTYTGRVGSRQVIEDANPQKYRIKDSSYDVDHCRIRLVDEDEKVLNYFGEEFTIIFTIESA